MASPLPPSITGPFVVVARVTAKPGRADEVEAHMTKIRASAESNSEPDCLSFRPARGVNGDTTKFVVFEKYSNPAGFFHHVQQSALQEFVKADPVVIDSLEYYEEEIVAPSTEVSHSFSPWSLVGLFPFWR